MKFEEVLPALKNGKKIRRKAYPLNCYICLEGNMLKGFISYSNRLVGGIKFMSKDLSADDWEIVKETRKVKLRDLTEEQYKKWFKNNCAKYDDYCQGCPFQKIKCVSREKKNDAWYLNKDLYSDKVLDQEIEIEE